MISRARVIVAAEAGGARPLLQPSPPPPRGRRIASEEAAAHDEAARIVRDANVRADDLLARARAAASEVASTAASEARAKADAETAARWIALRAAEARRFDRDAEPVVVIAVALAERLLGAALDLDPARIVPMARAVLEEARGARRAVIDAHPLDAAALRELLTTEGLDLQSVEVRDDSAALARGDLRLHTEMGTIDARLAPRFEQLATALRDALRAQPPDR